MKNLLNHEIFLVTGKGGVGKSTVAASLAIKIAEKDFLTKLVELDLDSYYEKLFKSPMSMSEVEIADKLVASRWTGMECLSEYVDHLIKLRGLGKIFFDNPVMSRLLNIAPGLFELAILGKLTSKQRSHGPEEKADKIVLDSFSTGHSLSMLRAPKVMAESMSSGPMHDQSQGIIDVIESGRSKVLIVCTPEIMAVQESFELADSLRSEFGIKALFILNRTIEEFEELPSLDKSWEKYLYLKAKEQKKIRKLLVDSGEDFLESPLVLDAVDSFDLLNKVSGSWNL